MKTTIIPLKVEKEVELYQSFDGERETLSEEVKNYLSDKMEEIPAYEQIIIEIETEREVDVEHFRNCYKRYINREKAKMEREIRYNNVKKIRFLVIGILFIALSALLRNQISTILTELLSIVGSFSIWELTNLILIGNHELKLSKLNLKRIQYSKIILKEKGDKCNA